ncbi:Response regulator [Rhodovastum atsumiense]|uniref:Response regulator n=1 Tax=Rhodovastum atsumiense TaxID=504468 RepID=A0A5M6J181_9PROT|nr:response regulator [Rhodovastum atsumiense]KAA5613827.1 response regulator [Rhodovastum atsumiense]CAH2601935.1 Response regulator [Rhodovastum atsumiense]
MRPSIAGGEPGAERNDPFSLRILLVEDDLLVSTTEEELLGEMGHQVIARATNAREALEAAARDCPDVALVDIRLADGDSGLDVARALLSRFQVRSIFVSGSLLAGDGGGSFQGTFPIALVYKPFTMSSLRTALVLAGDVLRNAGAPLAHQPRALAGNQAAARCIG